jgi:DNA-binding response OmpR family regulator
MQSPALTGRTILVLEDEVLIARDLQIALENTGSTVILADTPQEAKILVERTNIDGAILDHGLEHESNLQLYATLRRRNIPFVIHTGVTKLICEDDKVPHIMKPSDPVLVAVILAGLIRARGAQAL